MNSVTGNTDIPTALRKATQLSEAGSWSEAIDVLCEVNQLQESEEVEHRMVRLRHQAFCEMPKEKPAEPWPKPVPDHFPDVTGIPEIHFKDMSAELVASSIQHHGSILVREMFDADTSEMVRQSIDEAFARKEEVAGVKAFDPSPWYKHFQGDKKKGYVLSGFERHWAETGAGVLAVDSPRAFCRYIECIKAAGIDEFLTEYFGERPAISAKKTTLRRTPHDAQAGWHQDGKYYGLPQRSLNIWAAFTPCGVTSPSLDVFAKRFDYLAKAGGPGIADDAISEETIAGMEVETIVRPEFGVGDAILFDEMAMHRTGVSQSMTETRYAIEMWFFATSMFPHQQIPLYL